MAHETKLSTSKGTDHRAHERRLFNSTRTGHGAKHSSNKTAAKGKQAHPKFVEIKAKGKWRSGLKHPPTCNDKFYKCCLEMAKTLHFEFENSSWNNYDVMQSFLAKIKNKNITYLGDSVMKQFYKGKLRRL